MTDNPILGYIPILETIRRHFNVTSEIPSEDGSIIYRVEASNPKQSFRTLANELRTIGLLASLREEDGHLQLRILRTAGGTGTKRKTAIVLLLLTIAVASYDGFLKTQTFPGYRQLDIVVLYVLGILGIIGIHELGHMIAAFVHKIPSSIPYFIPGIPGAVPTMGAVITSSQPPVNRDTLFDLGRSGPIAGLIATIAVALAAVYTSIAVSVQTISQKVSEGSWVAVAKNDIFTQTLIGSLVSVPEGHGLFLSPLFFASSFGFLITFVNLLPAWQLDGGHVIGAFVSRRTHRVLTYLSVGLLAIIGMFLMSVLILLFYRRAPRMRVLDEVSPLSMKRKIVAGLVLALVIALYALTILDNMFFGEFIRPFSGLFR